MNTAKWSKTCCYHSSVCSSNKYLLIPLSHARQKFGRFWQKDSTLLCPRKQAKQGCSTRKNSKSVAHFVAQNRKTHEISSISGILAERKDHFAFSVEVSVSPTFFAWVFEFGGKIKIVNPQSVIDEYYELLKKSL